MPPIWALFGLYTTHGLKHPKGQWSPTLWFPLEDLGFESNRASLPPPTFNAQNIAINSMPNVIIHPHQSTKYQLEDKLQVLEEQLKAIKDSDYPNFNIADLCLVPNVVISPSSSYKNLISIKGKNARKTISLCTT
ncbi:hypothetical protein CR513_21041, partial [Mucuna pruriens]